jgi:hypothetical protein
MTKNTNLILMKLLTLLFFSLLLVMCSPAKQETGGADSTGVQQQDTIVEDQPVEPEQATAPAPALESKSFDEIPAQLQEFMVAVQDPDKLAGYINTTLGCFIISEGPGVYPIVTEVKTVEDLKKSNEFMLFMNAPKLEDGYYLNATLGPCDAHMEGIYFTDASNDNSYILVETYQTYLSATGDELTDEMTAKLQTLDRSLIWYGDVSLPSKSGEINSFGFLLALVDDKVCIAAIDTRGCGI